MAAVVRGAVALVFLLAAQGGRVKRRSQQQASSSCGAKGASAPSNQIVNGQPATECEWRWQVSLQSNNSPFCGGTLVGPEWVLTAAHCVSSVFDVVIGGYNMSGTGREQRRTAWKVYRHPGYDPLTVTNDIAMVRLDSPVVLNDCVGVACLPVAGADVQAGTRCWITGWGRLKSGGSTPEILQEAEVSIVSNEDCVTKFGYERDEIDGTMICAQGRNPDGKVTDSCQGDSGGPLVCESSGRWTLYGATSWGRGCAQENLPGIWTRVHEQVEWIEDLLAGNEPTPPMVKCPASHSYGPNSAGDCQCRWGLSCHKDGVKGACPSSQGLSSRVYTPSCSTCVCTGRGR